MQNPGSRIIQIFKGVIFGAFPRAHPRVDHPKGASLRQALALLINIRLGWKGLSKRSAAAYYKHFQIMALQRLNNFGTWSQCYKTFFVRDLRTFVLGQSVSQTRLEKFTKNKYSSLLRKSVIYGQKSFITLVPGVTLIKFYSFINDGVTK